MMQKMKSSHPHWLRSAIIASVGLCIALISVFWVGIAIRSVGPQTISLAYRIDRKQTIAFVRTTDEANFKNAVLNANRLLSEEKLPALPKLPTGVSYEYALMTGSGTKSWIVLIHLRNQEQKMFESPKKTVELLPIERIGESLGASDLFRKHGGKKSSDCTFMSLKKLPSSPSPKPDMLRMMLAPFSGVFKTKNGAQENVLILEKKNPSLPLLSGMAPTPIEGGKNPLFSLSIGHPSTLFAALKGESETANREYIEGLQGILQYRLQALTHRSDIKQAIDDLGRNGLSVSVFQSEDDQSMLLQMKGKNANTVDKWLEHIRSVATPAVIRKQTFLHGNSRTDVIAAPEESNLKIENGWMLLTSNSGSTESLSIATKGATMLLSNDDNLFKAGMSSVDEPKSDLQHTEASIVGTVDTDWLLQTIGIEGTELQSIIGNGARITWEATDEGDVIEVKYSVAR